MLSKGLKIFAAGSGSAAMSYPETAKTLMALARTAPADTTVLYLGTAMYDIAYYKEKQTREFPRECTITDLRLVQGTEEERNPARIGELFDRATIILVSGGNTLFAVDTWKKYGVDTLLKEAAGRGVVLCGGSAGAICWFDGGHSDSGDPSTFKQAMLGTSEATGTDLSDWEYVRVEGLSVLPGLCCPHHDRTQSNGIPRALDFDHMMKKHPGETGICIDHYAALVVEDGNYRVLTIGEDPSGSVIKDPETGKALFSADNEGIPGVWRKTVTEGGKVILEHVKEEGSCSDLFRAATAIVSDDRVEEIRKQNPC